MKIGIFAFQHYWLAFFFSSALPLLAQTPLTLYVSPQGRDTGDGSPKKPFQTIQRAQQEVRRHTQTMTSDVVVYLKGGTYTVPQSLTFAASDGGQGKWSVIYRANPGEKPVLSGGKRITGWVPDKNGIVKTSVKGLNFRQLYVNDSRAIRARQPDAGDYYRLTGWDVKSRSLMMRQHYVTDWKNFTQVEAVLQMFWSDNYVHLKSFEKFGAGVDVAYVTINDKEADILFPRPFPQKQADGAFHFENAYEFITQPGEWYLDTTTEMLYYLPERHQKVEELDVMAPTTETLLRVEGTRDNPVRNLRFEGLTFAYSNWTVPSSAGYINSQAGMYNLTATLQNDQTLRRPAAGISVAYAAGVVFEKNLFQHLGATGLDLEMGTNACRIVGNVFRDIAGNGVMVGAFTKVKDGEFHLEPFNPADTREVCTNDQVTNNYITQIGQDYYGTCGVTAGYPAGLKIEHNVIRNTPYSGISVGFGWTDKPNAMHDNRIAHNDIGNVMQLLCDGGGIYTLSLQPGTQIVDNYIHDIKRSAWAGAWPIGGIYLDQASGGSVEKPLKVEHNIFFLSDRSVRPFNLNLEGRSQFGNNGLDRDEVIKNAGIQPAYKEFIYSLVD